VIALQYLSIDIHQFSLWNRCLYFQRLWCWKYKHQFFESQP